ncbi:hypothetical protein DFJ74DRAFT_670542, partial [Hyaloraphidium curvatum]
MCGLGLAPIAVSALAQSACEASCAGDGFCAGYIHIAGSDFCITFSAIGGKAPAAGYTMMVKGTCPGDVSPSECPA